MNFFSNSLKTPYFAVAFISFALFLILFSGAAYSAYVMPSPLTPYEPTDKLDYRVSYENGYIKIVVTNPSYPDIDTNSYIYIPTEFNGQGNIDITLGNGFQQTGEPEVYVDWVADRFERASKKAEKWAKITTALANIGSYNHIVTVAITANTRSDVDSVVQIYKKISQTLRGDSIDIFLDIIYNYYSNIYNLPVEKNSPHWILPPSSSLIIKIPTRVVEGDHAFMMKINEIGVLDTGKTAPLSERNYLYVKRNEIYTQQPHLSFEWHSYVASDAVPINSLYYETGFFDSMQKQFWSFINSIEQTLVFYIKWPGSDLNIRVIDPNGNVYKGIEISENEESITIPNAMPGKWQIIVEPVNISYQGEKYELRVFGSHSPSSTPDFNLRKKFTGKKRVVKRFGYLYGFSNIYIEPKEEGSEIKYLEIEDEKTGGGNFRRAPPALRVVLYNDTNKYTISKKYYKTSIKNGKLLIKIPFSEGIELPVKINYRAVFKEIRNKCMKSEIFRAHNFMKCYRDAWKELTQKPKIFSLKQGMNLEVKYYTWNFFRDIPKETGTVATAIGPEGDSITKSFELDVFS